MVNILSKRSLFTLACLVVVAGAVLYFRPVSKVKPTVLPVSPPAVENVNLPWPNASQAAMGAENYGLLASTASQRAQPIASTAKIMTALAVLAKKPLNIGQQGPSITVSASDYSTYQQFVAQGQSVLPVQKGEQMSEYQALQALLIPSANNVAYILAGWAFGSVDNYLTYANQQAAQWGLKNTHLADPSGFSPQTVGTANDLVLLGEMAIKNPVLVSIVGQKQATFQNAGVLQNVNWLLGSDGIYGIKTGNTDQAGGCYLLVAKRPIDGQSVNALVSVVGAPDLVTAMSEAKEILETSDSGFEKIDPIKTGQPVLSYKTKWGETVNAQASKDLQAIVWKGEATNISYDQKELPAGSMAGTLAGSVTLKNGNFIQTQPLYLSKNIEKPSFWWRIFHK